MKKYFLIAAVSLCMAEILMAQSENEEPKVADTSWKVGGSTSINITQAYYENWTAGGVPSVAGVGFLKPTLTYRSNGWRWTNKMDLAYGLLQERGEMMRKTDDKIILDSKIGKNLGGKWYGAFAANFKTQFVPGWQDPLIQEVKISDFMSPGYFIVSLGADYNPNDNFNLYLAPMASKSTFVLDQELADQGAFGVEGSEIKHLPNGDSIFTPGMNSRVELGFYLKSMFKATVLTNVDFITNLELFANYVENVGNIDINWDGMLEMKINNYLSTNVRVELIYDDDIDIVTNELDSEGNNLIGPRLQVKQLFALGISYRF